jgi:hypothetical protein
VKKVWVTKYALTSGVIVAEADISHDMATFRTEGGFTVHFHGEDWHASKESAEVRFMKMIEAKRKSLQKQIKKLDALEAAGMKIVK